MVDAIQPISPYSALQPFGGSAPVQPELPAQTFVLPVAPGPVEQLQTAIRNSELENEDLSSQADTTFSQSAVNVVTDEGTVDLQAYSELIREQRNASLAADITARYGVDGEEFISDTGGVDQKGLNSVLAQLGIEPREDFESPETGFGGAQITGYSPNGEGNANQTALSFVSVVA
ncbi:hypothetical protein [Ponticaulis sp.]|uniref:hypothetical protein n=1 Tax=Ponticaulis sp. TaxID=2020902 RepID=UPI000B72AE84|nr:hypothetical protein [Ponticaulis sp.]MAI89044.1 hypothetical protein [Ponticaulis sp.]OUY01724.1 MAG: hypothetical protein CBB65_01000 [Hyphomonadaceae bacterium TMED5]|tara:strand:- start:59378 stop:59902 length:525 start_codon:yes stop_codon:yes gene_type:complete